MSVEHTQGPWIARRWWEQAELDIALADDDEREEWLGAPFKDIYSTSASQTVTACHDLSEMSPADAALLAAAPELLAALDMWAAWIDGRQGSSSVEASARNFRAAEKATRAAIEKARRG